MPALHVVGSSNTDLVIRLPRLPRAGETVSGGKLQRFLGGKGANQAVAAARLAPEDLRVRFTGAIGADALGEQARAGLEAEGLELTGLQVIPATASGTAFILVDESGENLIAVAPGANHALTPAHVEAGLADALPGEWLLLSMELDPRCVRRALERAKELGLRTLLNPAPIPRSGFDRGLLSLVDVMTPNALEAAALAGVAAIESWPPEPELGSRLRGPHAIDVVVTGGAAGICADLAARDGAPARRLLVPAPRVQPIDTVGAGDCFAGALAVGLAEGRRFEEALRFAVTAAAISVTREGAQASLPRRAEVEELLRRS
ncbi:MAG: ribokinase [Planctomycetes bacterium]|nr:ribokinase [Planctomycetota bacterium]